MAILSVTHPQILEFIQAKENTTELTNFNLSVGITEDFMRAVTNDETYNLVSPHTKEVHSTLRAKEVFALIVEMAHKNGEPGVIFLDKINEHNPTPHIGEIESTNPCGEQPLLANEACNLGSINLLSIFENGSINWDTLLQIVRDSVDFLDSVIDKSKFPLVEIEEMVLANRKIALGLMG
jgi:ribonucleoside-diphosphate reductase alpha chain